MMTHFVIWKNLWNISCDIRFADENKMEQKTMIIGLSVLASVFFICWISTWICFAMLATNPPVTTVFPIQSKEFVEDMHAIASYVSMLLAKHDILHSVAAGTLLGLSRFGHALEHDDDVDFVIKEQDRQRTYQALDSDTEIDNLHDTAFGLQFDVKGRKSYVDIMATTKQKDGKWTFNHGDGIAGAFTDDDWANIGNSTIGQKPVKALLTPNDYLQRYYGPSWDSICMVKPMHGQSQQIPFFRAMNIVNVLTRDNVLMRKV